MMSMSVVYLDYASVKWKVIKANIVLSMLVTLRASEAAVQCIVIGPVCGPVSEMTYAVSSWTLNSTIPYHPVCGCICGAVTTITRNCAHRSSPNWVFR